VHAALPHETNAVSAADVAVPHAAVWFAHAEIWSVQVVSAAHAATSEQHLRPRHAAQGAVSVRSHCEVETHFIVPQSRTVLADEHAWRCVSPQLTTLPHCTGVSQHEELPFEATQIHVAPDPQVLASTW
jgi:hypothetical protein